MRTPGEVVTIGLSCLMAICLMFVLGGCATSERTAFELKMDEDAGVLHVLEKGRPALAYRFGVQLPDGIAADRGRAGYIHPIFNQRGEALTDDFPSDHYHHRGVYVAWPHVQVGEERVDLWHLNGIAPTFDRWGRREAYDDRAVIEAVVDWKSGSQTIAREQLRATVYSAGDTSRALDIAYRIEPVGDALSLRGVKDKGYGGFNVRFNERSATQLVTDRGWTDDDSLNTPYRWAGLFGQFGQFGDDDSWSGIVVFPNRDNPDLPTSWMLRNYGLVGLCWPGSEARTIGTNDVLVMRYRLMVYDVKPSVKRIEADYAAYLAETTTRSSSIAR